nr:MAG TPA: hypothetical protein [Caudoviricetes sp.]
MYGRAHLVYFHFICHFANLVYGELLLCII